MDAWIYRLKEAHDAGYYRTESDVGHQIPFPWQNKRCSDCPFWTNSICQVHAEFRSGDAHTCSYFDQPNQTEAQQLVQERQWQGVRRWWEWFNDRGAAR